MYRILISAVCLVLAGCAASSLSTPAQVAARDNVISASATPAEPEPQPELAAVLEVEVEARPIAEQPQCRKEIPTGSRITIRRCSSSGESEVDTIIQDDLIREQMDRELRNHARPRR